MGGHTKYAHGQRINIEHINTILCRNRFLWSYIDWWFLCNYFLAGVYSANL